ncbi:F0F1 ATP synthase subunit B [Desulfonema ishimotonii]|uniref:ATP synthase subunit b n=1 Tax=Desulfonema ishimotonii TaxID=45657 RepID=A0A401FX39_9BACT|nr:hypothetical protein [Desulfonema ishimotonii]GBC61494.1 F0F1 ATP synthase subunit B [Desulfonema ishimotonii]
MLISGFTVFVQILNFLILIFLLRRFLYTPILKAMQAREEKIAARLSAAEQAVREAERRSQALEEKQAELDRDASALMASAKAEAKAWRETAVENARQEVETLRRAWAESLKNEQEQFLQMLRVRVTRQVMAIAEKAIRDLSGGDIRYQMVETFMTKVSEDRAAVGLTDLQEQRRFTVRSDVALKEELQQRLTDFLRTLFPAAEKIGFEVVPDAGPGIELISGDWKVRWSLALYMEGLEAEMMKSLNPDTRRIP